MLTIEDYLIQNAEKLLQPLFEEVEQIALFNQEKVLKAFQKNQIALRHFVHLRLYK